MGASTGTNWWNAVFGKPAKVSDFNLSIAGAGEDNTYGVSFNYFDQGGTAAYNDFRRASIRVKVFRQFDEFISVDKVFLGEVIGNLINVETFRNMHGVKNALARGDDL